MPKISQHPTRILMTELYKGLGGVREIAARLGVGQTTLYKWCDRGWLPGYTYVQLADLAAEKGVELDPELFKLDRKPWTRRAGDGAVSG